MNLDPAWVGVGLLFVTSLGSSIYTFKRNSTSDQEKIKADAAEFGVLKEDVKSIKEDIVAIQGSIGDGFENFGKEIKNVQLNCAKTSTGLNQRVITLEEKSRKER